jgi:hypothetical protein
MKTIHSSIALVLLLCGCSSARVMQTSGSTDSIGSIAEVVVAKGELHREAETSYNVNSMAGEIRQAILDELKRRGKHASDGATIEFTVTDCRLRSGVAVFWVGVMAGDDYLTGTAVVKRGDTILKSFEASAKGSESAWSGMATGRISERRRAALFCRMIAERIVSEL